MAAEPVRTARVLIVDDEAANVRLLERLLARAGHDPSSTTDSREALALYNKVHPDVILLDLRMPHLNGFQVLDQLRTHTAPDHVPVLVLTADASRESLRTALLAGARDYLTKPFDHEEVLLRVQNLIEIRFLYLTLQDQNRTLEARVQDRTRGERLAHERLEALSRRLVDVQEVERRDIARELHDQIGQMLTALRMTLRTCLRMASSEQAGHLDAADTLAHDLLQRVRGLALDLRPAMLDDLGLLEALVWYFEQYTARTAVRVVLRHSGLERRLPTATETAAYRIVQEALTNVARHAHVDEVEVGLWVDGGNLMLQIEDQGVGFDAEALLARGVSSGLTGMRERANLLGGWLRIASIPGESTTLTAMVPVDAVSPSVTSS